MGTEIEGMSDVDLLAHAFAHVMSGEYYPDPACCNDARDEILRRMQSRGERGDVAVEPSEHQR